MNEVNKDPVNILDFHHYKAEGSTKAVSSNYIQLRSSSQTYAC